MPTYEYVCKQCGNTFEEMQSIADQPLKRCPQCHTDNLVRAVGAGGGFIFKGSGFYLTDYRKSSGPGETKPPKEPKADSHKGTPESKKKPPASENKK
jgi:putative FmdB family regulatory protein